MGYPIPFFDNEPLWIMPTLKHEFIWDFTQSKDKVFSYLHHYDNLNEEKIIFCLNEIEQNPLLLKEIKFNSIKMMELLEVNQDFCFQLLMKILSLMAKMKIVIKLYIFVKIKQEINLLNLLLIYHQNHKYHF